MPKRFVPLAPSAKSTPGYRSVMLAIVASPSGTSQIRRIRRFPGVRQEVGHDLEALGASTPSTSARCSSSRWSTTVMSTHCVKLLLVAQVLRGGAPSRPGACRRRTDRGSRARSRRGPSRSVRSPTGSTSADDGLVNRFTSTVVGHPFGRHLRICFPTRLRPRETVTGRTCHRQSVDLLDLDARARDPSPRRRRSGPFRIWSCRVRIPCHQRSRGPAGTRGRRRRRGRSDRRPWTSA